MAPATLVAAAPFSAPPAPPAEAQAPAPTPTQSAFARVLAQNSRSSAAGAPPSDTPADAGAPCDVPEVSWQVMVAAAPLDVALPGAPVVSPGAAPTPLAQPFTLAPPLALAPAADGAASLPGPSILRPGVSALGAHDAPPRPGPRARAPRLGEPMAQPPALAPPPLMPPALAPPPLMSPASTPSPRMPSVSTSPSIADSSEVSAGSASSLARAAEPAPVTTDTTLPAAPAAALAELAASPVPPGSPAEIPRDAPGAPPPAQVGAEPAAKRSPPTARAGAAASRASDSPSVAAAPRAHGGEPRAAVVSGAPRAPRAGEAPATQPRGEAPRSTDDPTRRTTPAEVAKQAPEPALPSDAPARVVATDGLDEAPADRKDARPVVPGAEPAPIQAGLPSSTGGAHAAPVGSSASAGGSATAPHRADELEDARETPERQAIASAVSRMTLRRAAQIEVDVPELGRVTVVARERHAEVDVSLSAAQGGVDVLRAAGAELRSHLRDAAVPLGKLAIDVDARAGASGHGGGNDRPRGDGGAQPAAERADGAPTGSHGRVRFVL